MASTQCDAVFKRYLSDLEDLYRMCSGGECKPGERRTMSVREWVRLVDAAGLIDQHWTDKEAKCAFAWSLQLAEDEVGGGGAPTLLRSGPAAHRATPLPISPSHRRSRTWSGPRCTLWSSWRRWAAWRT